MFTRTGCGKGSITKSSPDVASSRTISIIFSFPFWILLGGCAAKPECDSIETRSAVLNLVSGDHANPLVAYAARNSGNKDEANKPASEENKSASSDSMKPLYLLGQRMVTTSTSKDKRTLQCSGGISVAVGDLKATKEITFTVQQSSDGKLSVSVAPFQF
jgi:hypothetical protein